MLSPSAAEQAVFFATHEIEPNDEQLLLRYKKELAEIPLWVLFLRPKSRSKSVGAMPHDADDVRLYMFLSACAHAPAHAPVGGGGAAGGAGGCTHGG